MPSITNKTSSMRKNPKHVWVGLTKLTVDRFLSVINFLVVNTLQTSSNRQCLPSSYRSSRKPKKSVQTSRAGSCGDWDPERYHWSRIGGSMFTRVHLSRPDGSEGTDHSRGGGGPLGCYSRYSTSSSIDSAQQFYRLEWSNQTEQRLPGLRALFSSQGW